MHFWILHFLNRKSWRIAAMQHYYISKCFLYVNVLFSTLLIIQAYEKFNWMYFVKLSKNYIVKFVQHPQTKLQTEKIKLIPIIIFLQLFEGKLEVESLWGSRERGQSYFSAKRRVRDSNPHTPSIAIAATNRAPAVAKVGGACPEESSAKRKLDRFDGSHWREQSKPERTNELGRNI